MVKFINPFTDYGFKKLFGSEASKEMLISFLNELLSKETGIITDLTYLNTELLPVSASKRKSFFDIYCKNEKGEYFIVEFQRAKHDYFLERLVYYVTFPIQNQAIKGGWDFQVNAVYVVAILDFEINDEHSFTKSLLSFNQIMNRDTCKVIYDKLTFVFVSMKQFTKTEDELGSFFDKWLYLLRNMDSFEKYPDTIKDKLLMKFLNQAELAQLDDRERSIYERSLKIYRDELLVERSREREKREYQIAMKAMQAMQVEKEAMQAEKDVVQAENQVLKQDLEVSKQKEFLVKQMIQNAQKHGMSIDAIAQLFGLTQEEITQFI